ncbi:SRPBCC domain-containing protein [Streptomyces sp. LRE541]|uniref:SRPBCC family protein n=1 Tax=Streptomyces sp. LRE541 TaxID=2931983 RepID=UPI00200DE9ED|nr:SRPBCC domain-containing protein [Streptomyces sp. LRE541]UPZ30385.1 SRPBCC domain-containing protein [Streptomyces sp. LRE541]
MEHEVFVPVPVERLREALADPARVARALPGLQQDAGTAPVSGRLKLRVGGHSITYRGTLGVSARDDGSYAVEADATEARGTGSVKLTLTLAVRPAEGGSTLTFTGTASADGRIADLPADEVASATTRLLNRFAEHLAPEPEPEEESPEPGPDPVEEEPPSSHVPFAEGDFAGGFEDDGTSPPGAPAEAAHARRTMIGRSAEEVDHAPPRGRYAPVPTPESAGGNAVLRWAAPAAALALASAIVVGRALRKRH